jgi:hypothetical protein
MEENSTPTVAEDPELKIWRIRYFKLRNLQIPHLKFSAEVEKTKQSIKEKYEQVDTKEGLWLKMQQLEDEMEFKKQVELMTQKR